MAKKNVIEDFINTAKESADGIIALSVVEISSGMTLGSFSNGKLDPELASAYNVEVVKSKLKAIEALNLNETIDDILISLSSQFHLLNCTSNGTHMVYLAADSKKSNLAILRSIIKKGVEKLEKEL